MSQSTKPSKEMMQSMYNETLDAIQKSKTENEKFRLESLNRKFMGFVVFYPETMIVVENNGMMNYMSNSNSPMCFDLEKANEMTKNVKNGHGQSPIMKNTTVFCKMKDQWLDDQMKNTKEVFKDFI